MRLRVLDIACPWFWLVIFWQQTYGEPRLAALVYGPPKWKRGWVHIWKREALPDKRGVALSEEPQR